MSSVVEKQDKKLAIGGWETYSPNNWQNKPEAHFTVIRQGLLWPHIRWMDVAWVPQVYHSMMAWVPWFQAIFD